MKIKTLGRGTLFTFESQDCPLGGGDSVYLIEGKNTVYLCDTHLGAKSMEPVAAYLQDQNIAGKDLVVFLSHSHWDHIWGAAAFPDATIVAHNLCRERIAQQGPLELMRNNQYQNGKVRLILPRLTFDSCLAYNDDDIEFIYAPGHTVDSAVCYDRRDKVLYVGDLVEKPHPAVCWHDLETYLDTMELISGLQAATIVSSHSGVVDASDIAENCNYIREFQAKVSGASDAEGDSMPRKLYLLLLYEDAIAQTKGSNFDYAAFHQEFWQSLDMDYLLPVSALLREISCDDLKTALESYLVQL